MSQFNVSMLLTADAGQARRELAGAGADLQQFGAKARQAGATASAGLKQVETQVVKLRQANAAVTGSLVAQFNDVGQMLAAGQSPLLLAAQQGTQISQALGPLGARGAVAALGQAFVGMLSPVNLAVFAAVAGLGLLGNALRDLVGEARTLEDVLGDLNAAGTAYEASARRAVTPMAELERRFGAQAKAVRELYQAQAELQKLDLSIALDEAVAKLRGEFGGLSDLIDDFNRYTEIGGPLQADALALAQNVIRSINAEFGLTIIEATRVRQGLDALAAADGPAETADALKAIRTALMQVRDESGTMSPAMREIAAALAEAEVRARELAVPVRDAEDAAKGAQASLADLASGLLSAAGASDQTRRAIEDAWAAITGAADATNVWAGMMSGVAAEVRGIGAALAGLGAAGIANAGKQIELEALRAGKSVAEARRTAVEAEIKTEGAARVAAARTVGEAIIRSSETETKLRGVELDRQLEAERQAASERERLATRSSSGAGAARQTDGAQRLIGSLQAELELLRATDPVQKEMLRNREALAGATAAERAQIEELIRATQRQELAQRQAAEAWDFAGQSLFDTLDGLIVQGETLGEVFANVAKQIASALLQSAILGSGPLAGLFGGAGGGLFDNLFGGGDLFANIGGFASGGMIHGPGGPRDDAILARLSAGEYVVNAAATARHRPLLEAINAAPRFAAGGTVGGGSVGASAGINGPIPIAIDLRLSDDLDARIAETSETVALRVTRAGVEQYDRKVLPKRVQAIQADPRRVA